MLATNHDDTLVPPRFRHAAVHAAFALVALLGTGSLVAMSLGDPELMVLVALGGAAVTLLALALLSPDPLGFRDATARADRPATPA